MNEIRVSVWFVPNPEWGDDDSYPAVHIERPDRPKKRKHNNVTLASLKRIHAIVSRYSPRVKWERDAVWDGWIAWARCPEEDSP